MLFAMKKCFVLSPILKIQKIDLVLNLATAYSTFCKFLSLFI